MTAHELSPLRTFRKDHGLSWPDLLSLAESLSANLIPSERRALVSRAKLFECGLINPDRVFMLRQLLDSLRHHGLGDVIDAQLAWCQKRGTDGEAR